MAHGPPLPPAPAAPGLMVVVRADDSPWNVVIEDDGRVAYAYLRRAKEIVGDVWLYNRGEAPFEPEWSDRSRAPFANPRAFVVPAGLDPIAEAEECSVEWRFEAGGEMLQALVSIRGDVVAALWPGAKPGWSKLAAKDGPLALARRPDAR
jgi:hypothetical protein